ncbi:predicted protein [Plenodomus lingam JN3]|uniref:Predicted protein n=1 Tax=Leptosphaeria maculans (strain JN3 / isolate v23.1.3 / race Av1-4-5-6-7-8) TaxID=985895 RepID=E4ZPD5_LEPMJ|nr:predicted protein [Plenodomus lingam JN3]CBX93160.1 predicted protein [Plenodomus lingam JN3]
MKSENHGVIGSEAGSCLYVEGLVNDRRDGGLAALEKS